MNPQQLQIPSSQQLRIPSSLGHNTSSPGNTSQQYNVYPQYPGSQQVTHPGFMLTTYNNNTPNPYSHSGDFSTPSTPSILPNLLTPTASSPSPSPDDDGLVISILYVDNLAKDFELPAKDNGTLRDFVKLGSIPDELGQRLSKADLGTRLVAFAATLSEIAGRKREEQAAKVVFTNTNALYVDLQRRLEITFIFGEEQTVNIRIVSKDWFFDPDCISVKNMHIQVKITAIANKDQLLLDNVVGYPSREVMLDSHIRSICSSVRNCARVDLKDSLFGTEKQRVSLSTFTYNMACKYKRGGPGETLDLKYTLRMALMRRFALDHADLLNAEEGGQSPTGEGSRKRKRGGGRVPSDEDFWARFDEWLADLMKTRGNDLSAPAWKNYLDESIKIDGTHNDPQARKALAAQRASTSGAGVASQSFSGAGSRNILTGL